MTVENIMKLADAYKDAAESQTYMDQSGSMYQWKVAKEKAEESREALRAALTEALAPQPVRETLSNEQIEKGQKEGYDVEDWPESWAFREGIKFAERAHGTGGDK